MKTLYLHIGTPKTGTTSIQNFCKDNQDMLANKGYYYPIFQYDFPHVAQCCNAHFLITHMRDENMKDAHGQGQKIIDIVTEEVLELFERYDNIILSEERIWRAEISKDISCWQYIQDAFMSKGITVKVIVYLRRQDQYMSSWWSQRVKMGLRAHSTISWSDLCKEQSMLQLDYYSKLEYIAGYVGKENIIVRIFDKNAFLKYSSDGSLLADFLNIFDLEYTDEYTLNDPAKNPGISKNNTEIKRLLNTLPELDSASNVFFRETMVNLTPDNKADNHLSMFSKEEHEQFLEAYKEGNTKIAQEYLGQEDLFDYSYRAKEKWNWNNDELPADIIKFYGATTLELLKEIKQLQKKQKSMEQLIQKQEQRLQLQEQHISNLRYKLNHPAKAVAHKLLGHKDNQNK